MVGPEAVDIFDEKPNHTEVNPYRIVTNRYHAAIKVMLITQFVYVVNLYVLTDRSFNFGPLIQWERICVL